MSCFTSLQGVRTVGIEIRYRAYSSGSGQSRRKRITNSRIQNLQLHTRLPSGRGAGYNFCSWQSQGVSASTPQVALDRVLVNCGVPWKQTSVNMLRLLSGLAELPALSHPRHDLTLAVVPHCGVPRCLRRRFSPFYFPSLCALPWFFSRPCAPPRSGTCLWFSLTIPTLLCSRMTFLLR
jgi:hypothetical protein